MKNVFLTVLIVLSIKVVTAQELPPPINVSTSEAIFVLVRDYLHGAIKLQLLSPETGEHSDYLDLRQAGYQIPEVALSDNRKYVFSLEVEEGSTLWPPLNFGRIVKYEIASNKRIIVFSQKNMTHFAVSPDGSEILVHYYPDEITEVNRYTVGLAQWCVLHLEANDENCVSVIFPEEFSPNEVLWANNKKLASISERGNAIRLVDKVDFTTDSIVLPETVYADHLLPIKDTEDVLIHVSPVDAAGNCKLLNLNISTEEIHTIADLACSSTVTFMSVDVHTRNLIIGCAGKPALIIDLTTGQILKELTAWLGMELNNVQWLNETYDAFVIGQLYYKGKAIATAIFDPILETALNISPIIQDEIILPMP